MLFFRRMMATGKQTQRDGEDDQNVAEHGEATRRRESRVEANLGQRRTTVKHAGRGTNHRVTEITEKAKNRANNRNGSLSASVFCLLCDLCDSVVRFLLRLTSRPALPSARWCGSCPPVAVLWRLP